MLVLLLPITWLLIIINLLSLNKKKQLNYNFGELVLITAIIWMLILVFLTEFLSLFHQLNQFWIVILWAGISGVLSLIYLLNWTHGTHRTNGYYLTNFKNWFFDFNWFYRLLIVNSLIILVATFVLGLIYAPNNPDGISYHLPRVFHWIQNQSVAFYPSHIIRQNIYPPGAEYIALHLISLSNTDIFVNLIQWFSMLGSLFAIYLITDILGGTNNAKITALIFVITLPIGLLQSNSIQNDYVSTFWFLCLVYFIFKKIIAKEDRSIYLAGASLGLAILTKMTNYFYCFSFLAIFFWILNKNDFKKSVKDFFICVTIAFVINFSFFLRNYLLFGKPIGDLATINIVNSYYSPLMTVANIITEFFYQILIPLKPYEFIVKFIFILCLSALTIFDPKIYVEKIGYMLNSVSSLSEDSAVNAIHLIFVICIIFFGMKVIKKNSLLKNILWVIFLSVILINTFTVWTIFNTRYYLTFFVFISPIIGVIVEKYLNRPTIKIFYIFASIIVFIYLIFNIGKPISNIFKKREVSFFNKHVNVKLASSYKLAADIIIKRKYKNIGLNIEEFVFEYPLWLYLKNSGGADFRIEHIDVRNKTGQIKINNFEPDVIIMCDECFIKNTSQYNIKYSKWAKVKIKIPHFTLYGQ